MFIYHKEVAWERYDYDVLPESVLLQHFLYQFVPGVDLSAFHSKGKYYRYRVYFPVVQICKLPLPIPVLSKP